LLKRRGPVKLLSEGDVSTAFTIRLDRISTAAKSKIEAAGGKVE
jgi:large subunit ribosomal protein L15